MTVPPLKDNGGAACAVRRSSSVVIPRPVDRPVSHGLKRSVEVLIRVSDRVPRPLITEPDLIRCPPTRFPRRTRAMRNRSSSSSSSSGSGGGGGGGGGGGSEGGSAKEKRNQGKRNTKEVRAYGTESRAFLKPGVRVTRRNSVKARRERERDRGYACKDSRGLITIPACTSSQTRKERRRRNGDAEQKEDGMLRNSCTSDGVGFHRIQSSPI
ncbi:hypothetical protein ALC57_04276 [Trachymyrmex cornetzi]|uniref:Uncharacterized protein n=1 Tax=Trachymyrmex cornetzi TaxID=471704 RepID=A0A195EF22_9HYME|nr:hypothetical protein ALC57_04276 [Trachymyrmex cornetzi]